MLGDTLLFFDFYPETYGKWSNIFDGNLWEIAGETYDAMI